MPLFVGSRLETLAYVDGAAARDSVARHRNVLHGLLQGTYCSVCVFSSESVATSEWYVNVLVICVGRFIHASVVGTWQPQREIVRSGVTALKFVQDGAALIGGCRDGVL